MKKILAVCLILMCVGCTANQRAKNFGGSATEVLPQGQKLIEATWKNDDLWVLTRPMREGEVAEEYKFKAHSSFGILEGEVIFKEVK